MEAEAPGTLFRVALRYTVPIVEADAFIGAWSSSKRHLAARGCGFLDALLLQSAGDPTAFVAVMTWTSRPVWEAYWRTGVPDPEGDARRNEVWVEVGSASASGLT